MKHKARTSSNIKRRWIALAALLAVLAAAAGFTAANFPHIKNTLLLRFAGPKGYMAYVETNYLLSQGKAWRAQKKAFSEQLAGRGLSGARADIRINQLLLKLLQDNDAASEGASLSGASLLFLTADKDEKSLFQLAAQVNDNTLASLNFLSDTEDELLYISCPQAGNTALALSTSDDDPIVFLLHYASEIFRSFLTSIYTAFSSDPYTYLLPYLDVITDVTLERDAPLPADGAEQTAIRLNMTLSLDTALDIAASELTELKAQPDMADPLLPCYELTIRLLEYVAERYPADFRIAAYVDTDGKIFGHEFFIIAREQAMNAQEPAISSPKQTFSSQEHTILSLTGILTPDAGFGKSGELTFFSALHGEPTTFLLSVSQAGFDAKTGLPSGKINFSCDKLSSLQFQLLFSEAEDMPKLKLLVRTLGVTAFSLDLTPSSQRPAPFPSSQDYAEVYHLTELSAFLQSLDFSGIISDFYKGTGIDLPTLLN